MAEEQKQNNGYAFESQYASDATTSITNETTSEQGVSQFKIRNAAPAKGFVWVALAAVAVAAVVWWQKAKK